MDLKILVVGSKGQLGTDCMSALKTVGSVQGVDYPEIDLSDGGCGEALRSFAPDVVVNCAAYTAVDDCEHDPACWKINADGPRYLAKWAEEQGAFLVQISTDYVFDGGKPLFAAYTEADAPSPVSEYGRSKLAGEQAVLESGAEVAILRTAWLYGANGTNFLKTMLRLAMQNPEREIRVVNDQFGSPTGAHVLAQQITAVVDAKAIGVFHATSGGFCSWYELAHRFLTKMNVPFRMEPCTSAEYPTPARRPQNSILENKCLNDLGLNIFDDWKKELDAFVLFNGATMLAEIKEGLAE